MPADTSMKVQLIVGSLELSKWLSYAIESDMLVPADAFSFRAANLAGELAGAIHKGDQVKVAIDDEIQMVGYVDDVAYDASESGAFVDITGRDLFGFLADCSAPAVSLRGLTLKSLAEKVSPWIAKWEVQSNVKLANIKKMKIEAGDTPLDVIQRFADQAKVAVWCAPDGKGIIGKPNYKQKPSYSLYRYASGNDLRAKNNIISGRVTESWREQFSAVTVGGSTSNTTSIFGGGSSKFKGRATDGTLRVQRPKNVMSGNVANTAQAKILAEETVQRGKFESLVLEYSVAGHYNSDRLWQADTLCTVVDEYAGVEGTFYVTRRRFSADESGRYTEVTLRQKDLWLP